MFTTLQSVRNKAGLQKKQYIAALYDSSRRTAQEGDGTTTVFWTEKAPIVDTNRDDEADATDVLVYVNGTLLTATTDYSVDVDQGKITFVVAPADNATLSITYAWSPSDDEDVTEAIDDAYGEIETALGKVYVLHMEDADVNADFDGSTGEKTLRDIETLLAAASLLDNRQGEDNPENGTKASVLRKIAQEKLADILSMKTELVDSEGQPFAMSSRILPSAYPLQADVDSGDIEAFVTRDTEF